MSVFGVRMERALAKFTEGLDASITNDGVLREQLRYAFLAGFAEGVQAAYNSVIERFTNVIEEGQCLGKESLH